jgi:hypothetical protein
VARGEAVRCLEGTDRTRGRCGRFASSRQRRCRIGAGSIGEAQAASGASIAKPIRVANLDADRAEQLFTSYRKLLRASDPEDADIDQWTELQYGGWEHAPLLNAEGLRRLLGGSLDSRSVRRSRSRSQQLAAVLAIDAPYVAVVDDDCRFVSLVDRQALLEELALEARLRLERSSDTG